MKRVILLLFIVFGFKAIAQVTNSGNIFYPSAPPAPTLQNPFNGANLSGENQAIGTQNSTEIISTNTITPMEIPTPESNNSTNINMPSNMPNSTGNNSQGVNYGIENTIVPQNKPPKQ